MDERRYDWLPRPLEGVVHAQLEGANDGRAQADIRDGAVVPPPGVGGFLGESRPDGHAIVFASGLGFVEGDGQRSHGDHDG